MTFERDHDRTHARPGAAHDALEAHSRRSASSALDAPVAPIASGLLQRKARDANGVADGADQAVSAASSSSGHALPDSLMRKFESSLGADLSSVRVHTGASSVDAASAVGAKAYTMGQDIHFGAGQYDPGSAGGQHLIAHEVAHTVQQRGGTPTRQNKLEVSTPHDAAELEADRAADAMVSGTPASVGAGAFVAARKDLNGKIEDAGDAAQSQAWQTPLSVDTITVKTDRSRVAEIIKDIDAQNSNLIAAEKLDAGYSGARATNTATKTNLSVFDDRLDVGGVDTAAFVSQYRFAYADYQRLKAEASMYTTSTHRTRGGDPLGTVTGEHAYGPGSKGLDIAASPESQRFRAARQNLNSGAQKMNAKLALVRGAANTMQGATYAIKAAAAQAASDAAKESLARVQAEIAGIAKGVSTVVKIASAVGGLAGGGGATNALINARTSPGDGAGGATLEGNPWTHTSHVVDDPREHTGREKRELALAMGKDAASLIPADGDMVTALVTAIGEAANKDKLGRLQSAIAEASAQASSFNVAAHQSSLAGAQATLEGHTGELHVLVQAFQEAKIEEKAAGEALMAKLEKSGGSKGRSQARAVLFLTDADRFLAQVESALAAGKNQQASIADAVRDRKKLRGTSAANGEVRPGEDEHSTQYYYQVNPVVMKGLWTVTRYKLQRVSVQFQDNTNSQGGAGTVEGWGGAGEDVANKMKALEMAKKEVQALQKAVQTALGLGAPGINA